MNTFALVVSSSISSSISLLQMLEPRALWMLQARVNFKGAEMSFFKLLFTGHSFKVSFRNVLGLLVVTSTLFQVALGHCRLPGPFRFLARLGFFNLPYDAVPWRF